MAIHWYPGHMHKAVKQMTEELADVDLIIELLDARLPYSSQNPTIARLKGDKPCIKILSKSDLADPEITAQWQAYFEQEKSVTTMLTTLEQRDKVPKIFNLCQKLVPGKFREIVSMRAMITGIPNVGKSTLINALAGRKIAKTGDEPAITKGLQKIKLDNGITLLDTPGILWPKIHNEKSGYRLAISGAIKDTAMEVEDIAFFLSDYMINNYPDLLLSHFGLASLPSTEIDFLQALGEKRGCLRAGGKVDLEKVSSILIHELRSGRLGAITLERPDMIEAEEQVVEAARIARIERDKLRKQKHKNSRG